MKKETLLVLERKADLIPRLQEKLDQWGVETVMMDLDGTLVDTGKVFQEATLEASGLLLFGKKWKSNSEFTDQAREFQESSLELTIRALRPEMGIHPAIMEAGILIAAQKLGLKPTASRVKLAIERMRRIYDRDVPPLFEGAIETLDLINAAGRKLILTTHAEEKWTWVKRKGEPGLIGRFAQVICFSILKPKSAQWETLIKKLALNPANLLIVGDDFQADIVVPIQLGARAVWVNRPQARTPTVETNRQTIKNQADLKRVIEIQKISEMIPAIIQEEH